MTSRKLGKKFIGKILKRKLDVIGIHRSQQLQRLCVMIILISCAL